MQNYDLSPATAAERLVVFINSYGVGYETGTDMLNTPSAPDGAALGYAETPFPVGEGLARARALRALLLDAAGLDAPHALELNEIASNLPWLYQFDVHGKATPVPVRDELAARVLCDLAAVGAAGHWNRIKVCANEDCKSLFYDTTKSRTRRWHSFEQCGNKANVAAHRQRQSDGS